MENYIHYYNLESYLFNEVNAKFKEQGWINNYDLFCIFIWKSNRAKFKNAEKIKVEGLTFERSAKAFTSGFNRCDTNKEKFIYVTDMFDYRLPTASAILTVLYPDEFTVYDYRVCENPGMEKYKNLAEKRGDKLWDGYQEFLNDVKLNTPYGLTLRERDQWLWGKSFYKDLERDCEKIDNLI